MKQPECPVCGTKMPVTSWKYCHKQTCRNAVGLARRVLKRTTATPVEKREARRIIKKVEGR